jgi:hypothetical protein
MAARIPWAETIVDGQPVLVDQYSAVSGVDYVCPECRGAVVRRREGHERSNVSAQVVRDPCFAHVADDYVARTCSGGESQRHKIAKLLVAQAARRWSAGRAMQPCFVYTCWCGETRSRVLLEPAETVVVDASAQGAGIGNLVPDVLVRHSAEQFGAIEIFHKHPIGQDKIEAYKSLAWWVELDAASIVSGSVEWRVRRASWVKPCEACATKRRARQAHDHPEMGQAALPDDPLMRLRRQLSALPIEVRLADVCSRCGLHTITDEAARLKFYREGGDTTCPGCGLTKSHAGWVAA